MAGSLSLAEVPRVGRRTRAPRHTFAVRQKPFILQPFMLAPVLPGETLKSFTLQSRAVTRPIANKLGGWWLEYYFFYVKHRDLAGRDDFTEMMLNPDKDMSAYVEAASTPYYHAGGTFNWAKLCMAEVTEAFFRDEGEAFTDYNLDGLPLVRINGDSILNSALLDDDFTPAVDEEITVGGDDKIAASEIEMTMRMWEFQRLNRLTEMTYEDWLGTYGVRPKREESHEPELLRYVREWQYPSNTIDPTTGSATSAVSWSISERGDKNRMFREPGFIIGVTVARPKIFLRKQDGSAADILMDAYSWLPAVLRDDPMTSVKKFAETAAPFSTVTDAQGYWLDIKDLFIHGDQFLNFNPAAVTDCNLVDLPTTAFQTKYPASADINALFASANYTVDQDGVVQLSILGALTDTTPDMRRY